MKLGRLNHVGVATPSIERSLELYRDLFGAEPHGAPFDLPAQGVRVCFVDTPNSQIELIEPLGPDSPIVKFLEKQPAGRASIMSASRCPTSRRPRPGSRARAPNARGAAHRRPRDAGLLPASEGHGRRADRDHGVAQAGALKRSHTKARRASRIFAASFLLRAFV